MIEHKPKKMITDPETASLLADVFGDKIYLDIDIVISKKEDKEDVKTQYKL